MIGIYIASPNSSVIAIYTPDHIHGALKSELAKHGLSDMMVQLLVEIEDPLFPAS